MNKMTKRCNIMANLQVKGIDEGLYAQLKDLAVAENRSVSQEVIHLVKTHLASRTGWQGNPPNPAEILLQLAGSWQDARSAEKIVSEINAARVNSQRLGGGL